MLAARLNDVTEIPCQSYNNKNYNFITTGLKLITYEPESHLYRKAVIFHLFTV